MPMKLFLLKRLRSAGYDEMEAAVVRASTEKEARHLAATKFYSQGIAGVFVDPEMVSCEELTAKGPPELIVADVYWG